MKTKTEIRDWLLDNAVDEDGDLYLSGLDFSDFDGDVFISEMIVKNNLFQSRQNVGGDLLQSNHEVKGNYRSININVTGIITFEEPKKALKEITAEELSELGYKLKEETK